MRPKRICTNDERTHLGEGRLSQNKENWSRIGGKVVLYQHMLMWDPGTRIIMSLLFTRWKYCQYQLTLTYGKGKYEERGSLKLYENFDKDGNTSPSPQNETFIYPNNKLLIRVTLNTARPHKITKLRAGPG